MLGYNMKRWRHLLVALLVVPALTLYIIAAIVLSQFITGFSGVIDLIYYIIAGLAWIPGAAIVIRWLADNEAH
ncbi:MAG: DUF2842 domain-containing protein, partial [Alphaproteobacteria bacterium]